MSYYYQIIVDGDDDVLFEGVNQYEAYFKTFNRELMIKFLGKFVAKPVHPTKKRYAEEMNDVLSKAEKFVKTVGIYSSRNFGGQVCYNQRNICS